MGAWLGWREKGREEGGGEEKERWEEEGGGRGRRAGVRVLEF